MLISYNWIQSYFKEKLPAPKELADIITMGIFEIEGMEEKTASGSPVDSTQGTDTILDVKVLPDRAMYGYAHRYVAEEIGALLNKEIQLPAIDPVDSNDSVVNLSISNSAGLTASDLPYCKRYAGRIVESVSVTDSPGWLKSQLEVLGQRSISTIVDLTNYVMLEAGQPLHAFDADKVEGGIQIRKAVEGEKITLLDGTVLELNSTMLVIADDSAPLALAGIKGGKKAEVTRDTKNIILESACFDASTTRKTAQKVGIRNDSSKRFENGVTPERAGLALALLSAQIAELNPEAQFGEVTDYYPESISRTEFSVSVSYISERLGIQIPVDTVIQILGRIGVIASIDSNSGDLLHVSVPEHRADLRLSEDITEEVGRIYGYDKIPGVVPTAEPKRRINKNFYYHNQIRRAFLNLGFSEVYTYTLTDTGDVPLANPLTVERAYLRNNIGDLLVKKGLFNLKNIDLLSQKEVRIFEIGKVFGGGVTNERFSLAFGIARSKQPKAHDPKIELSAIAHFILESVGVEQGTITKIAQSGFVYTDMKRDSQTPCTGAVLEFDIDKIVESLPDQNADCDMPALPQLKFKPISPYPFSVRDIAVFVPGEQGKEAEVQLVLMSALKTAGFDSLLAHVTLFDVFTKNKEGEPIRTSYAYRLVFQSDLKTLSEEEITSAMKAVSDAFAGQGWEVR